MERKKIYFGNLDALRFLSFLAVFFYHSFHTDNQAIKSSDSYIFITKTLFANGNLGVNFFFVLSGFLITYLLLKEIDVKGKVNVPHFYMRRVLRIWPLFYAMLLFGFVAFPMLKSFMGQVPDETADPVWYSLFLGNINLIHNGVLPDASTLGVLWSVAVEEQFYIFWPLIFFLFRKKSAWFIGLIPIAVTLFRYFNADNHLVIEYHTFSVIGDMAIGGLSAIAWLNLPKFRSFFTNAPKALTLFVYLVIGVIFIYKQDIFDPHTPILIAIERLVISLFFAYVILEQNFNENSLFKLGKFEWVNNLGKVTYGLYCLHFVGILITLNITKKLGLNAELWQIIAIELPLSLIITIIISKLSFRFFESYFLKLKDKFGSLSSYKN